MKRLGLVFCLLLFSTVAQAASLFAVCTVTCTWNNVSTAMWSSSSGGATGQSPPVAGDTVTLDAATCVGGVTCTITVAANVAMQNFAMGSCTASTTGCILDFSANNNNVAISGIFNNSGTGTRRLNMGNGTWSMSGTGVAWNMITTTNLTFNANSSTIQWQATNVNRTMSTTNQTYSTIQVLTSSTGSPEFHFSNTVFTVANLIIGAGLGIYFDAGGSYTISTSLSVNGTSSKAVFWNGEQNAFTNSGTGTMTWTGLLNSTFTGNTVIATSSLNLGNVSGATITSPTGSSSCIIGGWLLWRDMPEHVNDNFPAWLEKAA